MRDKLIELLDDIQRCGEDFDDYEIYGMRLPNIVCNDEVADHLIANGVTIQKWIPVTERLPNKITNKVIVRCQNNYIGFGHYENYKGKQTWYNLENDRPFTDWDLEDCESYAVTHWMPLPEPQKEADDDRS